MTEVSDALQEGRDSFPPTLDQKELVDKVFVLEGYRNVKTKFGERHVATVRFDSGGESVEAWLGGVFVNRQLKRLSDNELLPCRLRLTQDDSMDGSPYVLEEVADGVPAQTAGATLPTDAPTPLGTLLTAWVKEVGGMAAVADALQAKTLMAAIANALAYDREGKLVWRLSGLSLQEESELRVALEGKWQPPEEIPYE